MAKQVDSTNLGGLLTDLITRIKNAFWRKGETSQLGIDNDPTSGSNNLVKSGGVYTALSGKVDKASNANDGDLAVLDANGNIKNSGLDPLGITLFPNMDGLTPIQTIEYDLERNEWCKLFERTNPEGTEASDVTEIIACRVTVTGDNMTEPQVMDLVAMGPGRLGRQFFAAIRALTPDVSNAAKYGLYQIRNSCPKALGSGYGWVVDFNPYYANRHLKIEVFKTAPTVVFFTEHTKSNVSSTYHSVPGSVSVDGTKLLNNLENNVNGSSTSAAYINGYLNPFFTGIIKAGEALINNQLCFISTDGKAYPVSNTGQAINPDSFLVVAGNNYAVNTEIGFAYLRTITAVTLSADTNPNLTIPTFVKGDQLFLRCHMSNGLLYSDAVITTEVAPGYTWIALGYTHNATGLSFNTQGKEFFTLDANGKLTHIDGREIVQPAVPADVLKYTAQTLTDPQKAQARTNIGAGTYSKPSTGIPASDIAPGVIPTVPTEVFVVTYGTTTQSEILAAVAAGQLPVCKYEDNLYVYAGESSADYSQFTSVLYDTAYRIYVKNSTWGSGSYEVYSKPSGGIPASDIASGVIPAAPVNADWNASSGLAQILNKPTVPTTYAGSPTAGGFANKAVAIPFGSVDSDSTATNIKATVDNFPATLTDGVCAYIRNDVIASASGWTLNINGTGAKPVYQTLSDESRVTTVFSAAVTYLFIYNSTRVEGGCWDIYYGYNANDNTIGYNLRTNKMSLPVTSACYRYRLLFTSADGTKFVPANASSSTNATSSRTTTQTPINPFGSIRYYSYTTAVTSGSRPGAAYLWEQYELTLGYSFNRTGAALTLTAWKPVYIKCAPRSDGSAIIDAETPYTQTLPTTADGKIYIFLGVATAATTVEMVFHHPVYYHDGTRVSIWPGPVIGDIQTALDAIIGVTLSAFTIGGVQYYAEEEMTWGDWINSEYNTDNYTILTGADTLKYISLNGRGDSVVKHDENFVRPTDTIIDGGIYTFYGGIIED